MVNNLKTNDSYNPNSIIPKAINVYTPKMHFSYHYQKQRLQILSCTKDKHNYLSLLSDKSSLASKALYQHSLNTQIATAISSIQC